MSLRNVTPNILEGGPERAQLEEDLKKMRCTRLLERLWGLKHEEIVRELLTPKRPNVFDGTIRDWPSYRHPRFGVTYTAFRAAGRA